MGGPDDEINRLKKAMDRIMVGGNHLASALISWLGAGDGTFPPYQMAHEQARERIEDISHYDAWVCWKAIMEACDEIQR